MATEDSEVGALLREIDQDENAAIESALYSIGNVGKVLLTQKKLQALVAETNKYWHHRKVKPFAFADPPPGVASPGPMVDAAATRLGLGLG